MDKFRNTVSKILATWVSIGTALAILATSDLINVPQVLLDLFSENVAVIIQEVVDSVLATIGIVIAGFQTIRAILIGRSDQEERDGEDDEQTMVSISKEESQKAVIKKLRRSPFRV